MLCHVKSVIDFFTWLYLQVLFGKHRFFNGSLKDRDNTSRKVVECMHYSINSYSWTEISMMTKLFIQKRSFYDKICCRAVGNFIKWNTANCWSSLKSPATSLQPGYDLAGWAFQRGKWDNNSNCYWSFVVQAPAACMVTCRPFQCYPPIRDYFICLHKSPRKRLLQQPDILRLNDGRSHSQGCILFKTYRSFGYSNYN